MLHNTGPFGPNDVPVNVNPQSNMTSMSGRMNIGNNINNLAKIPQQSPQMPNPHFNLPDYPTYGLNMNAGLSPFQNFHHVGFQQNSMPQSSIHDSWQNNMLPMNLNMQSEHSMLGFAQYGKPDVSEQSFNKSMLNVPQVHTKAFHKQMGMDVNYHYNLNPSYRPYADYNLDLSSKHKSEDGRQFVDPHSKDRLALSPHYAEQIDLSNKQKMHNFTRPYLDTTKSLISQKHDSIVNINNELAAHLQRSKEKHSYFDNMKSQMGLDNRYESELDLSKSLKSDNLNANYQNVSADLRYYKDQGIRPENDTALPKFSHPDNFNANFSNLSSDLRIYKNQDPQNLEKNFSKSQLTDNLNTAFQSVNTDLRFYKDKNTLSHSLENTLSKSQKSETAFQNVSSDLRFYKDKDARSQSITDTLSKVQKPENLNTGFQKPENLNTAFQNPNSDLRYYKDKDRPQSLIDALSKTQKSENFNTSFQNVNSDLRFYKDKSQNLEDTLSKIHKAENLNTDFLNTPVNRFHSETKSKPHNNEEQLHKIEHPEPSLITKNTTSVSADITKYKEHDLRSQSIEKPLPKQQQPENLITNYQNINTDVKFYKDQDSRRRSLENTVKMIENILSHSSNSRKSQSNSYQSKSVSQEECMSQKDKSELNDAENYSEAENDECNEINDSNVTADTSSIDNISDPGNKSDESDMNTSNEMDIDNSNENDDIENASNDDNENPSNDESESEDNKDEVTVNPLKNPLDDNPLEKEVSNTNNIEEEEMKETEVAYKSESEESSSEEDIKPKDLEAEIIQQVIKVEDNVVVKVEIVPSMEDIENYNPFHRDIFGVQNDETANHDIIESEASITVAKEVIRNGAAIQGAYFECPHCNLYFNQPKRFLIHTKWHTFGLTNDKRTEVQKEKELRKQLRKEARVVERMNQHEVMDVANTPGKKFNCSDCDKVFLAKASLKNHKQRFHPTRVRNCKICHKTVLGWMALRTHMATHTCESGYQCDKCPKRFKHPHSLAKHRDTHLEKTHGCQQCPKKFGSQTLLNVHMKTHERALRGATFRCTYCGKGFFESYSLQVHERTHRNERPYQCEICNTSFGTNSSLKRHLKVSHSTSKPFECPTCHRSFISEAIRDRHAMRNHGNPEDFKFVCRQCPCKYLKMKDLRKHMYKVHPKGKRKKKSQSESE